VEPDRSPQTAVIIGASSGIGEALARELNREGWRLCLMARRMDRLEALRQSLAPHTVVHGVDVTHPDTPAIIERVLVELGGADLVIISAGTGHNNRDLREDLDMDTVTVNVVGFMKVAQTFIRHFVKRRRGHLVGISSVAAVRSNWIGAAYAASKAFQSLYLDGLRDMTAQSGLPIVVTEVQPGFVDTAMMKPDRPLGTIARFLLVISPAVAARQIMKAVQRRAKHVYVPRRYRLIAFVAKFLPRPG
jgi:short-subunit dehydrogenase